MKREIWDRAAMPEVDEMRGKYFKVEFWATPGDWKFISKSMEGINLWFIKWGAFYMEIGDGHIRFNYNHPHNGRIVRRILDEVKLIRDTRDVKHYDRLTTDEYIGKFRFRIFGKYRTLGTFRLLELNTSEVNIWYIKRTSETTRGFILENYNGGT